MRAGACVRDCLLVARTHTHTHTYIHIAAATKESKTGAGLRVAGECELTKTPLPLRSHFRVGLDCIFRLRGAPYSR